MCAVVVEEGMNTGMVCHLLVVKNHFDESPNWVLVEQLGDVSLGEGNVTYCVCICVYVCKGGGRGDCMI